MNGAESLVRTLVGGGVNVCFANPGTSEMHFVAALDRVEGMRCVLGLFEGVVTGAADGYYRMTDNPAATLLHLGPGLANGLANIHNANKAGSGMVNIVGDHATYHRQYDAPLTSDIEGLARPSSHWVKTSPDVRWASPPTGPLAIAAARQPPGQIATLILPADTAWNEGSGPVAVPPPAKPAAPSPEAVEAAARVLRSGEPTLILLTGRAVRDEGLALAGRIAAKTGARLIAQGSNARTQRGRGRVSVERIPYVVDQALKVLAGLKHIILVGVEDAGRVFRLSRQAEPAEPAEDCQGHVLARPDEDLIAALEMLAEEVGARGTPAPVVNEAPPAPAIGRDHVGGAGRLDRGAVAGERDRRRRGGDDRARLFRADQGRRRRMTGCRTWAARSGWGCRWRPARRWPARTARSSACRPTAARCTRCRRCGHRRARGSTSRRCCSRTAATRYCAANWPMSGPAIPGARRSTCSISATRTSTGSAWRKASACRGRGSPTWTGSTAASPKGSRPRGRIWSRWCCRREIAAMTLRDEMRRQRDAVLAIAAQHGVSRIRLFGSVARGEERPDSDIDLLIDLDDDRGFGDYLGFVEDIERLFGRQVEAVLNRSLSPHFRPFIEAEAQVL